MVFFFLEQMIRSSQKINPEYATAYGYYKIGLIISSYLVFTSSKNRANCFGGRTKKSDL